MAPGLRGTNRASGGKSSPSAPFKSTPLRAAIEQVLTYCTVQADLQWFMCQWPSAQQSTFGSYVGQQEPHDTAAASTEDTAGWVRTNNPATANTTARVIRSIACLHFRCLRNWITRNFHLFQYGPFSQPQAMQRRSIVLSRQLSTHRQT